MLTKFLNPKNDVAFKKIFGTENNRDILIHFLNDMITFKKKRPIKSVSILKTNLDPDTVLHKCSILDILCRDDKGNSYIVEMQLTKTKGFEKWSWKEQDLIDYESVEKHIKDTIAIHDQKIFEGLQQGKKIGHEEGLKEGLQQGEQIGLEKGLQQGIEKGEQIGEKRIQVRFAKKLLGQGNSIQSVAELTDLPIEDLEALMEECEVTIS